MNKEEWEDYLKLGGEITEKLDNTATYENWLIIQEYVDRLQERFNKKDKALLDIKEIIKNNEEYYKHPKVIKDILDIVNKTIGSDSNE